jgi:HSP20 family protein
MFNKQAFESGNKGGCGPMGFHKFNAAWARRAGGLHKVPVNIEENETEYILSIFASGLVKENIRLDVKDDLLTVSYTGAEESGNGHKDRYTYQEHTAHAFDRAFKLNDKVLTDYISARYTDGILKVTLPKNPETNKPAQHINVA